MHPLIIHVHAVGMLGRVGSRRSGQLRISAGGNGAELRVWGRPGRAGGDLGAPEGRRRAGPGRSAVSHGSAGPRRVGPPACSGLGGPGIRCPGRPVPTPPTPATQAGRRARAAQDGGLPGAPPEMGKRAGPVVPALRLLAPSLEPALRSPYLGGAVAAEDPESRRGLP
uniref:Uncharacterized protein n=1 Tax=Rangifer tarandus platyrhynchus TaxID=3082113 RepID=A0ACB0FL86_RANTA|nr:unnamed protein product [Rangifer tarandus platyrhynchus]